MTSLMRDVGYVMDPTVVIDAKATENLLHRLNVGRMKHIDVAHLWLQDEGPITQTECATRYKLGQRGRHRHLGTQ